MLDLLKIAVTGGIASGKSTVCQFLKELGAYVVNADAIVHASLTPDTDLGREVIRSLGLTDEWQRGPFRKVIAEKVFKDPNLLALLEHLLHPVVLKKIEELYREVAKLENYTFFVVEMPLLFEIQAEGFYDIVIAVLADESLARERFEKLGYSKDEYEKRMERQMSPSEKQAAADYTLLNNGSLNELKAQVILLNKTLQEL